MMAEALASLWRALLPALPAAVGAALGAAAGSVLAVRLFKPRAEYGRRKVSVAADVVFTSDGLVVRGPSDAVCRVPYIVEGLNLLRMAGLAVRSAVLETDKGFEVIAKVGAVGGREVYALLSTQEAPTLEAAHALAVSARESLVESGGEA
ncbi:MAG: hypothetical protein DRJ56_04660 [Thermoprotei archaeon]|nr:MAG: hypothetical protein DRJ56_04660 [Thermoprotei archaeon]